MPRSQVAADDFSAYADGHLQAVSGGNWTDTDQGYNGWVTVAGHAILSSAGASDAFWSGAGSFTADQYATLALHTFGLGNDSLGVVARCGAGLQPTANNCYRAYIFANGGSGVTTLILSKVVNGSEAALATDTSQSALWATGDTVEIEAQGTTIRALRNGTVILSVTDASLSTGVPGVIAAAGASAMTGGPWAGGNLTAAGAAFAGTPSDSSSASATLAVSQAQILFNAWNTGYVGGPTRRPFTAPCVLATMELPSGQLSQAAPGIYLRPCGELVKFTPFAAGSSGFLTVNDCGSLAEANGGNQVFQIAAGSITAGVDIPVGVTFQTGIVISSVPTGGWFAAAFDAPDARMP